MGGSPRLAAGRLTCYSPGGGLQRLQFMPVPEAKHVKNRVHIDFGADDVQAAVDRLVAMGASIAWEEDFPPDLQYRNLVLRDPEGNEFCVGGPGDAECAPSAEPAQPVKAGVAVTGSAAAGVDSGAGGCRGVTVNSVVSGSAESTKHSA